MPLPTASDLPHRRVIHSLDGMRGLAALWVVAYHSPFLLPVNVRSGYLAVDVFFVLSGFVIAKTYLPKLSSVRDIWPFMLRRIGRLFPMMVVALAFMLIVLNTPLGRVASSANSAAPALVLPVGQILASLTFVSSLGIYPHLILNAPMWSVSVEFYIYILFAVFAIWARRRPVIAAVIILAGYATTVYGTLHVHHCAAAHSCMDVTYDFGIFRCVTGFFLGYLAYQRAKSFRTMRIAAHPGTQYLLIAATVPYALLSYRIPALALSVPFLIYLLVLSVCADTGPLAHFLAFRPFLWLGHVSYSLYALDGPIQRIIWVASTHRHAPATPVLIAAYFALLLLLAWLANTWIEDPARHWFAAFSRSVALRHHSNAVAP